MRIASIKPSILQLRIVFVLYMMSVVILSFCHEYWRDELQPFLIVKNSNTLSDLFSNTKYEGHPSLWFLILFGLKQVVAKLYAIKLLHLLITAVISWLVLRYSPFKFYQKILLLCSYFLFYEYTFIVRNYALGVLFVFAFCSLFPRRHRPQYFTLMALLIFGMMMTNFYSFFIGFCLSVMLLCEHLYFSAFAPKIRNILPGYLLILTGMVLFVVDTLPPTDYGFARDWTLHFSFEEIAGVFARFFQVFVPIPPLSIYFWNSVIVISPLWQSIFGSILFIAILFFLPRHPLARIFIVFIFLIIMAFSYFKFNGYQRHNGHLFIALMAMAWIQQYYQPKHIETKTIDVYLLNFLLVVQLFASPIAVFYDLFHPFSQAENTANYINKHFPDALIVAHEDAAASSVSAFVNNTVYYPASDTFGSFIVWNKKRLEGSITSEIIRQKADSLSRIYNKEIVYLFTSINNLPKKIEQVISFTDAIEPSEQYYLFVNEKTKSLQLK